MAVAAETLQYTSVDDLPEIAAARDDVRLEAEATMAVRREQISRGEYQYVPLPIDVLSTAQKVLTARQIYGENSLEQQELWAALRLDCSRLLAEWYRKNKPEYFDATYQKFDPATEDFYSHGLSIGQMTYNALTPQESIEDDARRINERVEEATPQLVRKLGGIALKGVRIRTISECTDTAIQAYEVDFASGAKHRGYNGYVPEIEKVMIRDFHFDDDSSGRFEEQLGMPGVYITHAVFQEALKRRNLDVSGKDKTGLHATQFLAKDDLIDFAEHLDNIAGEHWQLNLFLGEVVETDYLKDYQSVRIKARERREKLSSHSDMVADFVLGLAEAGTDGRKAPAIVEEFVKKMLMALAREDDSLAVQIFDQKTADGLARVAYLESIGQQGAAAELLQAVERAAPGGGYCGAGSCGLKNIDVLSSKEANDLKKLGFNSKNSIKDTQRSCKCGVKRVYYDLKSAQKGCGSCGAKVKY